MRSRSRRRVEVPVLPPGHRPLRVLHVSDLHLTPGQRASRRGCAALADLEPDLVVNTGDNLAHRDAVARGASTRSGRCSTCPACSCSAPTTTTRRSLKNPLRYLLPDDGKRNTAHAELPWRDLRAAFERRGWLDLTNRRTRSTVGGHDDRVRRASTTRTSSYDDLDAVAGPADADADLRIGVTHAPYPRVLDPFAADGYDADPRRPHPRRPAVPARLRRAGHQLRPRPARPRACTGTALPVGRPGVSWLHVSAGLGTSPYAPVRFGCRPEATLLTLVPRRPEAAARPDSERPTCSVCSPCSWQARSGARVRGVAQLGSALRSGRRGRRFKSCHPDQ